MSTNNDEAPQTHKGKVWVILSPFTPTYCSTVQHTQSLCDSLLLFPQGWSVHAWLESDSTRSIGWFRSRPASRSLAESCKSQGVFSSPCPMCPCASPAWQGLKACLSSLGSHTILKLTQTLTTHYPTAWKRKLARSVNKWVWRRAALQTSRLSQKTGLLGKIILEMSFIMDH